MPQTTYLIIGFGLVIFYLIILGIAITSYVMQALALYGIAKKRDLKNAWLSWVPVANYWIIGSITDDFDAQNGQKRKWRITLLTFALILLASGIAVYSIMIAMMIGAGISNYMGGPEVALFAGFTVVIYLFTFVIAYVALAFQAITYICMFKTFEFITPKKAVKYLILSVMVPLAYPICLLKCKDICPSKHIYEAVSEAGVAKGSETEKDEGVEQADI